MPHLSWSFWAIRLKARAMPLSMVRLPRSMWRSRSMMVKSVVRNHSGFTLIELIVVMVLISVIGSIASSKLITLDSSATEKGIECAVSELNSRECLTWSQTKLSTSSWINDDQVFSSIDTNLGDDYSWGSKHASGGTLTFKGRMVPLKRTPSTLDMSGNWSLNQ